jgi:hypothetical protein
MGVVVVASLIWWRTRSTGHVDIDRDVVELALALGHARAMAWRILLIATGCVAAGAARALPAGADGNLDVAADDTAAG